MRVSDTNTGKSVRFSALSVLSKVIFRAVLQSESHQLRSLASLLPSAAVTFGVDRIILGVRQHRRRSGVEHAVGEGDVDIGVVGRIAIGRRTECFAGHAGTTSKSLAITVASVIESEKGDVEGIDESVAVQVGRFDRCDRPAPCCRSCNWRCWRRPMERCPPGRSAVVPTLITLVVSSILDRGGERAGPGHATVAGC